jgi:hypothetical protein
VGAWPNIPGSVSHPPASSGSVGQVCPVVQPDVVLTQVNVTGYVLSLLHPIAANATPIAIAPPTRQTLIHAG